MRIKLFKAWVFILVGFIFVSTLGACKVKKVKSENDDRNLSSSNTQSIERNDKKMQYLTNTYVKLHEEKNLTVGYIGGSVTSGYGATDEKTKSWRSLSTEWLKDKFKESNIVHVNAAIGGTGSPLGLFRLDKDLMSKNPDLIFIEFAVNDNYNGYSYAESSKFMESIIVKTINANPYIDIVIVLVTDKNKGASEFEQLRAHKDVAKHYGIPVIEINKKIMEKLDETGNSWSYYFIDNVHPNDEGYAYYNEVICEFLASELLYDNGPESLKEKVLPQRLNDKLLDESYMILSSEIDLSASQGWDFSNSAFSFLGTKYGGIIAASTPGSTFKTIFSGTAVGIFCLKGPNMGKISYSIDGASSKVYDAYRDSANPKEFIIATDLSEGEHTLEIQLLSDKNPASTDTNFVISALLINGEK